MRAGHKLKRHEAVRPGNAHLLTSLIYCTSGSRVPQSGIYEMIHRGQHRQAHEVVLISGKLFPRCEGCGEALRFRLLRAAPYILHDVDFASES